MTTHPNPLARLMVALGACAGLAGQAPVANLLTGRCAIDLPLDAGQDFGHRRFLVLRDRTYLFDPAWTTPETRWRLRSRWNEADPAPASGIFRARRKWRDGALWMQSGNRILMRDPALGRWVPKAEPAVEFMDFEVDMTGRILLVCTADPRTRGYRALLEAVSPNGRDTAILAPYPDPGCQEWGGTLSPVAAATLQAGYESVQILEFTVLFNPLSRRLFVFRPLEDRLKEVKLGLPLRDYPDLAKPGPLEDLCWQVLPKDTTEAWLVMNRHGPGLTALSLDLFEGTAGEPADLPGLSLPVFPDASGRLAGLDEALGTYSQIPRAPAGTTPLPPSSD